MTVHKGLNLVEILIAITIMGIFAAVAVPSFMGWLAKGKKTATVSSLKAIQSATEEYHATVGNYPQGLQDLMERPSDEKAARNWTGPYIKGKGLPRDGFGNEFVYQLNQRGAEHPYELYSLGASGSEEKPEEWMHARDL